MTTPLSDQSSARTAEREWLVETRGLSVRLGGNTVLDNVDLRVCRGEIITLVGLNGSGKTTLVRAILGLLRADGGDVHRRPGLRIGYAPQHLHRDATLPLTVARFLTLGAAVSRAKLRALLEEVGAGAILDEQLSDISGGEFQRALLARALLREPDLLVLDEPLAGVDVAGQTSLYRLIAHIRDRYQCGVLLVSHDLHVVMAATDTVVCINHHVCCTGSPESVTQHPEFVQLFGTRMADVLAVYTHHHDHAHDADGHVVPLARHASPRSDA